MDNEITVTVELIFKTGLTPTPTMEALTLFRVEQVIDKAVADGAFDRREIRLDDYIANLTTDTN